MVSANQPMLALIALHAILRGVTHRGDFLAFTPGAIPRASNSSLVRAHSATRGIGCFPGSASDYRSISQGMN
jgi:hypothetical protein